MIKWLVSTNDIKDELLDSLKHEPIETHTYYTKNNTKTISVNDLAELFIKAKLAKGLMNGLV